MTIRENPFRHMGQWYWLDEHEQPHGPYNSQADALFGLLAYTYPDYKPVMDKRPIINALLIELPFVLLGAVAAWWWMHS